MKKTIIDVYLAVLRWLAKLQLKKNQPLIIGITGSAGKSSCVKMVSLVLADKYQVKYTKKGNSETGIPLEILRLPVGNFSILEWLLLIPRAMATLLFNWQRYQVLVVEMGIDSNLAPKNMETLLKIISPKIGVVLNVNHVHLGNFVGEQTTQAVADEKGKLLFNLPAESGLAIFNHDQAEFKNFKNKIVAPIKTFSLKAGARGAGNMVGGADISLVSHHINFDGSLFKFNFKGQNCELNFKNQLIFKEAFGSVAVAILIADFLEIDLGRAIKTLETKFEILPGRGRIFAGINGSVLIDSSYNSSLEPTSASLKILPKIKLAKNRTIAVLGDMRELGTQTESDHQALEKVALQNADLIVSVGPLTQKYFASSKILKFIDAYEALEKLKTIVKANDLILIKGSQNTIFLEIIVAGLLKNKSDMTKLCRRSKFWDQQRALVKK